MRIPEACYLLTGMDLSGTLAELVYLRATTSQAAANPSVSGFYTVPKGKILVMQSMISSLSPGAAQKALRGNVIFVALGISRLLTGHQVNPAIAAAIEVIERLDVAGLMLPEGVVFSYDGAFDAGIAANKITLDGTGWLIPRGSVVI